MLTTGKRNWVVMPVLGNLHYTWAALDDLAAQDIDSVHTVVVNNGSVDGTVWHLADRGRAVTALHYYPAKSVAYAWNRGLELAFAEGASRVLVVNNDVRLRPDTYRLLDADGGLFVTAVGVSPESGKYPGGQPLQEAARPHPDFSCYLIRRECWERVGKFDERCLWAYVEDAFYHVKMHRLGVYAKCIDLPFLHYGASTIKAAPDGGSLGSQYAAHNRELFRQEYGCVPGTPEYEALFSEASFGSEAP